jgi:uncharacterized protein YeaO (DUF488 family)
MAIRIVRLGTERAPAEGLRIGTVRRPPRGVPKSKFSSSNWYDVWFPNLAPAPKTIKLALATETQRQWGVFVRRYRAEMASPENSRVLDLLAALSHEANFSVGCYCVDEVEDALTNRRLAHFLGWLHAVLIDQLRCLLVGKVAL